jgi:DNA-binding NarL/FixJ family response regulator
MTTVVLIEDHAKIRAIIKEILGEYSDIQLIGEAANGRAGYDMACSLRPQVVVIDLSLWHFKGDTATHRLKGLVLEITLIGMSAGLDDLTAANMLEAGADACLAKEVLPEDLVPTIRKARRTTVFETRIPRTP